MIIKAVKFILEGLSVEEISIVFGVDERHLQRLEHHFKTEISLRGDELYIFATGEVARKILAIVNTLRKLYEKGSEITESDVVYAINMSGQNNVDGAKELAADKTEIVRTQKGKPIYAKTINQKEYFNKIKNSDLVFGIGPAGCGKTYLAVVIGVLFLKQNAVKKIVITRPVVEAGESLGFLPGDLKEKVDPYLRPLYDAFHDVLGLETTEKLTARGIIEIAPLAYMRGRTLEDAYVVLDEAQNTTKEQMKMFLTRLGTSSKMVITGDVTQIDLPKKSNSGLVHVTKLLDGMSGIEFAKFGCEDVVRHPLVQKIIERYENEE